MVTIKVKNGIISFAISERAKFAIKKVNSTNDNNFKCTILCNQKSEIKSTLERSLIFGNERIHINSIQVNPNVETSFWLSNNNYEIEVSYWADITKFILSSEVPSASPIDYSNNLNLFMKAKSLQELNLSGASITGDIISLGTITKLKVVDLKKSLISGRLESLLQKLWENGKRDSMEIDVSYTNITFDGFANTSGVLFIFFDDNGIKVFADKNEKYFKASFNNKDWTYNGSTTDCICESTDSALSVVDIVLPQTMDTKKARTTFLNAIEKNYMKKNGNRFEWIGTKPGKKNIVQLAYLCGKIYGYKYAINGNEGNRIPTKAIEEFFGVSRLNDSLSQSYTAENRQPWRPLMDELVPE